MNTYSEIAAYKQAFDEVARFGRVLSESERREAANLEERFQLEYSGNDPVLRALGEED